EGAVAQAPRPVDGFLEDLGTGGPDSLEGRVEVVGTEDDHGEGAPGEEFLEGVAVLLGAGGVRLGEHDARRAAEGDPAAAVRRDVVVYLQAERVTVEGERLVHVVDGDMAVVQGDGHAGHARRPASSGLLGS